MSRAKERPGGASVARVDITLVNRQRRHSFDLAWLRKLASAALDACRPHPAGTGGPLPSLESIEITILGDDEIASVNERWLRHRGPTDVITFAHGEILIGAGTAVANARRYRRPPDTEVALYIVHGLLHLNGWSDHTVRQASRMRVLQARLLRGCLKAVARP